MFPDNNWYGHRKILLEYVGEKDKKIFASLQHGWSSQVLDNVNSHKKYFYPILVWSKYQKKFFNKKSIFNVHAIGAPFLYLCKMLNTNYYKNKKNYLNRGVIVFPAHSSQNITHATNHKLLIEEVKKNFSGPYTVCFYYFDLKKKEIEVYKKNNWRIICCVKNKIDEQSLIKLHTEINNHETVVTNEFGSSLFYGMYLKKKTRIILESNNRVSQYSIKENNFIKFYKNKYPELFKKFLNSKKGYRLAQSELGSSCIKTKEELKKILGINSFLKSLLSNLLAILYDFKYSPGLRNGKNLKSRYLKKYIAIAGNTKIYNQNN